MVGSGGAPATAPGMGLGIGGGSGGVGMIRGMGNTTKDNGMMMSMLPAFCEQGTFLNICLLFVNVVKRTRSFINNRLLFANNFIIYKHPSDRCYR